MQIHYLYITIRCLPIDICLCKYTLYSDVSYLTLGKAQFGKPQAAQRAALCLGTTVEDLARLIFTDGGRRSTSSLSTLNPNANKASEGGMEALEGFVVGLYQEAFNAVLYLINR